MWCSPRFLSPVCAALLLFASAKGLLAQGGTQISNTVLSTTSNSATVGTAVRFTATVSPNAATGKVALYDGVDIVATSPLSSGTAAFNLSNLGPGKKNFLAVYLGNSTYTRSESNSVPLTVITKFSSGFQAIGASPTIRLSRASSMAAGDFNGDGITDLIVNNDEDEIYGTPSTKEILVYLGNSAGGFTEAAGSPIMVGTRPKDIAASDFNGDGRTDIAVGHFDGTLSILLGVGSGRFEAASQSPLSFVSRIHGLATLDVNKDGIQDIALATSSGLLLLSGRGDGTFSSSSPVAGQFTGTNSNRFVFPGLRSGDFNGDGWPDLALARPVGSASTVLLFINNRRGGFQLDTVPIAPDPTYLTVGDWDGDGRTDFATVGSFTTSTPFVTIVRMLATGPSVQQIDPTPSNSIRMTSLEALDFNGDGNLDLIACRASSGPQGGLIVLLGDGNGKFSSYQSNLWGIGSFARTMLVADFNRDGRQDLALANAYSDGALLTFYFGAAAARMTPIAATTTQSTRINTEFPQTVSVSIVDELGNSVRGIPLTYSYFRSSTTQPGLSRLPGLILSASSTSAESRLTSGDAFATNARAVANEIAGGPYQLTASAPGVPDVVFSLTNLPAGAASSISLISSQASSIQGELVTLTVTMSPPGNGTASLSIFDGEDLIFTSPNFRDRLTTPLSNLRPGTRTLTARYAGDNTLAANRSPAITQTIRPASGVAPAIREVVNGASLQPGLAPGAWMTIYGSNLATTTRVWEGSDFDGNKLPTQLDGIRVTIDGTPAYVYFISPTQINFLAPKASATGFGDVQVLNASSASNVRRANRATVAPAFFTYSAEGGKYVIAQDSQDFSLIGPPSLLGPGVATKRATPGQLLTLYATGLGETSPAYPDGQLIDTRPISTLPQVTIGGLPATVSFAGLTGPGLYQLNVIVPQQARGDAEILIRPTNGSPSPSGFFLSLQ